MVGCLDVPNVVYLLHSSISCLPLGEVKEIFFMAT